MSDNTLVQARRLNALDDMDILDTPPELAFDRITALCRRIFRTPISTLTFLDGHRQWFKSEEGFGIRETERRPAFCNYAVNQQEPLVVPDTHADSRFADNAFVRGKPFLRFYAGAPIKVSGETVGTLCVMDTKPRDFSEEAVATLKDLAAIAVDELLLRNLSMVDGLTGAMSRRAFRAEGERMFNLANRHGHRLTCAVFDIDHFKSVNDRNGHAIGDAVLSAVVATCRGNLRGSDVIGRIGGEEFGILLPHTDLANGIAVLEKARAAIGAAVINTPSGPIRVTASFGGASFLPGHRFDDTLHNADLAMYSAKEAGRNKVNAWIDPLPSAAPGKRRVLKAGQITFNSGRSTIDCTIRGLSSDMAMIDVISTANVPGEFKLSIASDGFSRACRVVTKSNNKLEVAFS